MRYHNITKRQSWLENAIPRLRLNIPSYCHLIWAERFLKSQEMYVKKGQSWNRSCYKRQRSSGIVGERLTVALSGH